MAELIENILDFARGRLGGGFVTTRDSEKPLEPVLLQVIDELRVHPRSYAFLTDLSEHQADGGPSEERQCVAVEAFPIFG